LCHERIDASRSHVSDPNIATNTMKILQLYPYLCVRDARAAIDFYVHAFGAQELFRLTEPAGRVGHAELRFGEAVLMLAEEFPEYGILAARADAQLPFCIHLHVDDADAAIARALAAGASLVRAAQDEFYGERSGRVRDPFGYEWLLGHQLEELTPQEMQRRYTALLS
jgi:PhnB protein